MNKSTWLENYEKEVTAIQKKKSSNKIVIPIVLLIFAGVIIFSTVKNGGASGVDVTPYLYGTIGIVVVVILFAVLLATKSAKKDLAKGVRENLDRLLTTPEEVAEFDFEVNVTPNCELQLDTTDYIYFTRHYLMYKFNNMSNTDYRFARLSEIAQTNFATARNNKKVHGMGIMYYVDLLDANGEKLMGLDVAGKKKMEEFEEMLTKFCPGIQLKEHKLF